jgi:hydrogenase maturation factor
MNPPVAADRDIPAHRDTQAGSEADCDPQQGCITCGDVAVELRVLAIDVGRGLALCGDDRGRRETVEIALVEPLTAGDRLLVHAGTAIAHLGAGEPDPSQGPGPGGRPAPVPGPGWGRPA